MVDQTGLDHQNLRDITGNLDFILGIMGRE